MRREYRSLLAVATLILVPGVSVAQNEASRVVAGGGISIPGWMGKLDPRDEQAGLTVNTAKLAREGNVLQVTTGPAITYWNPANTASGNYTVKATFTEAKYMSLNDHPHPYGIVIAGNDMGTGKQAYLYCAAYGNGTFILRGFGPDTSGNSAAFRLGGVGPRGNPEANPAINKAAVAGQPVTQEIAVTVKSDAVECSINGTVVATHPKANVVAAGKLKSTDGVYGIRFAHNTEATVTGLSVTKN